MMLFGTKPMNKGDDKSVSFEKAIVNMVLMISA